MRVVPAVPDAPAKVATQQSVVVRLSPAAPGRAAVNCDEAALGPVGYVVHALGVHARPLAPVAAPDPSVL